MKTSQANLQFLLLIIFCLLLTSCNSNIKQANNLTSETSAPQSTFSDRRINKEFSKESNGIVYNSYIISDHNLFCGSIGGIELFKVCDLLDINTSLKDRHYYVYEPENKYQGNFVPSSFYIEKNKVRLTFKVKGKIADYFVQTPYPQVQYDVFKNNALVKSINVYQYKEQFYLSNLEELLKAMDIKYCKDDSKNLTFVDSPKATKITGRLLAQNQVEITPGEKSTAKLLYNFYEKNSTYYKDIVLKIEGKNNYSYNVYDSYMKGRSDYYCSGSIKDFKTANGSLLQVCLSDAPTSANIDTAIFRFNQSEIIPVFDIRDYKKCLDGNFTLNIGVSGNCTFKDKFNKIEKGIDLKLDKTSTVFNVDLRDECLELNSSGLPHLKLVFCAVDKANFLFAIMDCEYKNGRFKPSKVAVTDKYTLLESPNSLKDPYKILFEYGLNQMSFNASGPETIDNLKSINIRNLNVKNNSLVTINLAAGYYATQYVSEISPEASFNLAKNKGIKDYTEFNIYNDKYKNSSYHYGIKGLCGTLQTLGYYREGASSIFPNHSNVKSKIYSGKTILGKGDIYILNCDIFPKELRTAYGITYEVIYAWIPIDNENLAYNLTIGVPFGEKSDNYVNLVKKMLSIPS